MIAWIYVETCLGLMIMEAMVTGMAGLWALNKYLKRKV